MSDEPQIPKVPETPSFAPRLYGIALLVTGIVLIGLWLVSRFTASDLARDLQIWQEKLNIIAESRASAVNHWVANNFTELRTMADNPSLQLYMTELQTMNPSGNKELLPQSPESSAEPAQKVYLRNLLVFTAERAGFSSRNEGTAVIAANVQPESKSGLAVLDSQNQIVVSTVMQNSTRDMMLEHAKQAAPGQEGLIDVRKDKDGTVYIGFIVPVFSIQGNHDAASQIGRVVGIKTVGANLFDLLKHPGTTEVTMEAILVRKNGDKLDYISPLLDGTQALGKQVALDPAKYSGARLAQTIGDFVSDMKDYRGRSVLATSHAIAGTPWVLVVKIDRHEALANGEERRADIVVFFFLIIAIIVLIVIALWRYAHSKRSMMMSGYFRALAAHATAQEQLLRLVADNQPSPIYIVDNHQIYHFANQSAAGEAHMLPESIDGKTLADVRGAAHADNVGKQCKKALLQQQVSYDVQRTEEDGQEKVIRSVYVPLDHIPVASLPQPTPGVLVVEYDISEVMRERERRLATNRQLIEMLVRLVDMRDPFAADHSQLVAHMAQETAVEMELDSITVETTRTAGCLMNIGKIIVPQELLTKTDSLTAAEKRTIRESLHTAAELLQGISFDGPVVETLRQWQEQWDGSGPLGLSGEAILISARIIASANAFIGMISPRSWRNAMPIEAATKVLLDQSGAQFDRRVVIALVNYVENHHGREWLNKVVEKTKRNLTT